MQCDTARGSETRFGWHGQPNQLRWRAWMPKCRRLSRRCYRGLEPTRLDPIQVYQSRRFTGATVNDAKEGGPIASDMQLIHRIGSIIPNAQESGQLEKHVLMHISNAAPVACLQESVTRKWHSPRGSSRHAAVWKAPSLPWLTWWRAENYQVDLVLCVDEKKRVWIHWISKIHLFCFVW